jgi:hypothetical protein
MLTTKGKRGSKELFRGFSRKDWEIFPISIFIGDLFIHSFPFGTSFSLRVEIEICSL